MYFVNHHGNASSVEVVNIQYHEDIHDVDISNDDLKEYEKKKSKFIIYRKIVNQYKYFRVVLSSIRYFR